MANKFYREAVKGSDTGVWADFELPQNRAGSIGQYTPYLYNDSGVLKLTKGRIGYDNSSNKGVIVIDTIPTILLTGVTNQNWAKIEVSVSGETPSFTAADISGATDPTTLPTGFTGAYDQDKQGFYIETTKRVIGLAWKDSGGNLVGIINVKPFVNGYIGTIDDGDDAYYFEAENEIEKNNLGMVPVGAIIAWHKDFTGVPNLPSNFAECDGSTISDSESPLNGQTLPNLNGDERFLAGDSTSGTIREDRIQGHEHTQNGAYGGVGNGTIVQRGFFSATAYDDCNPTNGVVTDGVNGTPRIGTTTYPKHMTVVWIIRIK